MHQFLNGEPRHGKHHEDGKRRNLEERAQIRGAPGADSPRVITRAGTTTPIKPLASTPIVADTQSAAISRRPGAPSRNSDSAARQIVSEMQPAASMSMLANCAPPKKTGIVARTRSVQRAILSLPRRRTRCQIDAVPTVAPSSGVPGPATGFPRASSEQRLRSSRRAVACSDWQAVQGGRGPVRRSPPSPPRWPRGLLPAGALLGRRPAEGPRQAACTTKVAYLRWRVMA